VADFLSVSLAAVSPERPGGWGPRNSGGSSVAVWILPVGSASGAEGIGCAGRRRGGLVQGLEGRRMLSSEPWTAQPSGVWRATASIGALTGAFPPSRFPIVPPPGKIPPSAPSATAGPRPSDLGPRSSPALFQVSAFIPPRPMPRLPLPHPFDPHGPNCVPCENKTTRCR